MSHLHTVNSPTLVESCLDRLQAGDSLLLLEDGVYSGFDRGLAGRLPAGVSLYVLQGDLDARGLNSEDNGPVDNLSVVTMAEFVRLCCDHDKIINWF